MERILSLNGHFVVYNYFGKFMILSNRENWLLLFLHLKGNFQHFSYFSWNLVLPFLVILLFFHRYFFKKFHSSYVAIFRLRHQTMNMEITRLFFYITPQPPFFALHKNNNKYIRYKKKQRKTRQKTNIFVCLKNWKWIYLFVLFISPFLQKNFLQMYFLFFYICCLSTKKIHTHAP